MKDRSLWYQLPDGMGLLEFPPDILAHLRRFQQTKPWHKEAGGQLFWNNTSEGHRRVTAITGPRPTDKRTRVRYIPDHAEELREIDEYYQQGAYFLGDWHTHPQRIAQPSPIDISTIKRTYARSTNAGPGFLLVITGTAPLEHSLSVSWCNQSVKAAQLSPLGTNGVHLRI